MKMGRVRNHQDLRVWQLGMDIAVDVYRLSEAMPAAERYGLTSQIRRAATAIPANIAEGAGRASTMEFARFVSMARGSLAELETHLVMAERLGFLVHDQTIFKKVRGLRIMLSSLRRSLVQQRSGA